MSQFSICHYQTIIRQIQLTPIKPFSPLSSISTYLKLVGRWPLSLSDSRKWLDLQSPILTSSEWLEDPVV